MLLDINIEIKHFENIFASFTIEQIGKENRVEYLTHEGISLWLETGTIEAGGKQAELTKNELRIIVLSFEHDGVSVQGQI